MTSLSNLLTVFCFSFDFRFSHKPYHKTKLEMKKIEEVFAGGVSKLSSISIEIDLMIPLTMVNSNTRFCKAIQISYDLRVEAKLSFYKNIKMIVPITIGSFNSTERQADDNF